MLIVGHVGCHMPHHVACHLTHHMTHHLGCHMTHHLGCHVTHHVTQNPLIDTSCKGLVWLVILQSGKEGQDMLPIKGTYMLD